jgi:hypothetical protein
MVQDWAIRVVGRDVAESKGGILILEWTLNQSPDPEWTPFLVHSSVQKSGSATFAFSQPVISGNKVRMPVEDRDIEAAASYIDKSISYANERFESQVVARRQREAERKQQEEAAQAARLDQVRDRLRHASDSEAK